MQYTIAARETFYKGIRFRSRLEARWAAFFEIIQWKWKYEPVDLQSWTPDFWVAFPCGHSECRFLSLVETRPLCIDPECACKHPFDEDAQYRHRHWDECHFAKSFHHELYVEVKPYHSIEQFKDHIVWNFIHEGENFSCPPHPAMFGIDPFVVGWQMIHGAGGGWEDRLSNWTDCSVEEMWIEAGNIVQWRPQ